MVEGRHPLQRATSDFTEWRYGLCAVLVATLLAACSVPSSQVRAPSSPGRPVIQTGIASWYGPGFHGKPTASGVIYNQGDLTAAHQTLPLGTRVLVTNLDNGKSLEVTINDRGPFAKGRILDLSYAAGETLGMIGPGTIPIRLEVLNNDGPRRVRFIPSSLDYTLQLGSFSQLENAQQLQNRLAKNFADVSIVPIHAKDITYFRVQLGTFPNRAAAEEQARQVSQSGFSVIIMEK